jgi:transketolase
VGLDGEVLGISRFGASAPGHVVLEKLGISVSAIVEAGKRVLGKVGHC